MPTYGYRCETCGTDFDVWQKMSDPPGADCPACGGPGKRLFFPAGLVFKGGGFYKTDSRPADSGAAPTTTDSKPAADKPTPSSDK